MLSRPIPSRETMRHLGDAAMTVCGTFAQFVMMALT
jgi:hypothetical protein